MGQIIKPGLSIQVLYDWLDISNLNKYILVTNNLYKKRKVDSNFYLLLEKISMFYHKSKQFYCSRIMTYTRWLTIVRQLCKYFELSYTSKIRYYNSTYETTLCIVVSC